MSERNLPVIYEFGAFVLDPAERQLRRADMDIPLTPKAFDVLVLLVRNSGRTVSKEQFMREVWPDTAVEEGNLTDNIFTLRQILGDDSREPLYIKTVPRQGYRFVADVREIREGATQLVAERTTRQLTIEEETDLARTSGQNLPRILFVTLCIAAFAAVIAAILIYQRGEAPAAGLLLNARTLAVLPFKPLIESQRDPALELGMTDALIAKLSGIRQITVRPTSAVLPFVSSSASAGEIGSALGVDALLDGKVQRENNRVRVSVQLIRAADGSAVWADRFDEEMTGIFELQDAIADRVSRALALQLNPAERQSLKKHGTSSVAAYQHYLRGRYFWNKRSAEGFENALKYYRAAIAADPQYALAHAGLAETYVLLPNWTRANPREVLPLAERAALRAVELDPNIAEAWNALATVKMSYHLDFPGAGEAYRRAVEVNPNYSTAHQWYGEWLTMGGRLEEGLKEVETAHRLEPLSPILSFALGIHLYYSGRLDEAERLQHEALELDPSMIRPHMALSRIYFDRGQLELAAKHRAVLLSLRNREGRRDDARREQFEKTLVDAARAGGRDGYLRALRELLHELDRQGVETAALRLEVCSLMRDLDCAFRALDEARRARHPAADNLKVDPYFAVLRDDPRYLATLREMGLPP